MTRVIRLAFVILLLHVPHPGAHAEPDQGKEGEPLKTGMRFPSLEGKYLTGRPATLPDAAAGKIALLALGFTYDSRHAVEEWSNRFRERFRDSRDVTFYEIPMIGGFARLARFFIDRGMRRGTPEELHENVVTVYGGTGPWKKRMGYDEEAAAYLVLLDRNGEVRWLHSGFFDPSRFQELADLAARLRTEGAASPRQHPPPAGTSPP